VTGAAAVDAKAGSPARKDSVENKVREALADVGVNGDAETQPVLCDKLEAGRRSVVEVRLGIRRYYRLPPVLRGDRDLGEIIPKIVSKREDWLMLSGIASSRISQDG
jgi:hypothetical protein